MTTTEVKILLGDITDMLGQVRDCAADSELDEHHAVTDHYDCEADFKDVADHIYKTLGIETPEEAQNV